MYVETELINGRKYGHFECPLLLASVQFVLQWVIVELMFVLQLPAWFFGIPTPTKGTGPLSSFTAFHRFFFPSAATALDIGLSNLSLRFITVILATCVKSSAPLWTLLIAFVFQLETPSARLLVSILCLSGGMALAVLGESPNAFEPVGFLLVFAASMLAGIRWVLMQLLLQGKSGIKGIESPLVLLKFLLPLMAATLGTIALVIEDVSLLANSPYLSREYWYYTVGITFGMSILALLMTTFEFMLVRLTDAVTLMVIGLLKEASTVIASTYFFQNSRLTPMNALGFSLILLGVSLYKWRKTTHEHSHHGPTHDESASSSTEIVYESVPLQHTDGHSEA